MVEMSSQKSSIVILKLSHYDSGFLGNLTPQKMNKGSKLPVQIMPSPLYPVSQAQVKEPAVFEQTAFWLQLSVLMVHSSSSKSDHFNMLSYYLNWHLYCGN